MRPFYWSLMPAGGTMTYKGPPEQVLRPVREHPSKGELPMKRRDVIQAGAAATLAAAAPLRSVFAQQKTVWKAADVHPLGYPTVEAVMRMGKKIETATSGRISLQMYPLMQLGGEKEMIEQAQLGALQLARISVGPMGPVVDELNVFNLPFIFRDEGHMRKVIDGPIGDELLARISANPNTRLVALCWMDAGTRNVYSNNPIFVETMNAMGGNGVAMGFDQLFSALQTGVVDGAENNPPTLLAQNHNQVSKVYSLTGHLIIPEILVFSKRTWDTLSKTDQDLLRKVAREAQTEERGLWDKMVAESTQKLKAAGMQFVETDKKAFYDATRPIREKYGSKHVALIKRIEDTK